MGPVDSYRGMLRELREAFRERYRRRDVNITGIMFARPESVFAQKEILPHIDYWHHRSDNYTDFFCPGYEPDLPPSDDLTPVATVGGSTWFFSNRVLFQNSVERSCPFSIVMIEESAEPLTSDDPA